MNGAVLWGGAVWKHSCSTSSALSNSLRGLLVAAEAQKSLLFQDQTFFLLVPGNVWKCSVNTCDMLVTVRDDSVGRLCGWGPSMAG